MEKTAIVSKNETKTLCGELFAKMVTAGAANLRANAEAINALNVFPVPDGDTGSNMSMTMESGAAAIRNRPTTLSQAADAVSQGMLMGARGNSGVILSQFFYGVAKAFEKVEEADAELIGAALTEGVKRSYGAVLKPAEGTLLTVARESVDYAVSRINGESTAKSIFKDLLCEAERSLERTPDLLPILKEANVVDSGGMGFVKIAEGMVSALEGKTVEYTEYGAASKAPSKPSAASFNADSEMTYGYCTELLLQLQNAKTDVKAFDMAKLNAFLESVGNSVVSFMNGSVVKIHVHTMTPEKVLEYCRGYGEFLTVKIENMSVQHTASESEEASGSEPEKEFGIVAVCSGEGMKETFADIGADAIIDGGQTNNPSTNDFIEAFEKVNAGHIFVFPNNSNIILAAKQAAQMYDKADVRVIESKTIGEGYVGITSFDASSGDVDEIETAVNESMSEVETANITVAVRDAEINGVSIKKGDVMGLIEKTVAVAVPDIKRAISNVIEKLFSNAARFMLTVFCGKDADETVTEYLKKYFKENVANGELYLINGGQSVYPYILVAE